MQIIKALCDQYGLGEYKQAALWAESSRLWCVQTTQQEYAIKQFAEDPEAIKYAVQGEAIAQAFFQAKLPVVTALAPKDGSLAEMGGQKFQIFNWQQGATLSTAPACAHHAMQIGNLLARLHTSKLKLPNIEIARWQKFGEKESASLTRLIQDKARQNLIKHFVPELFFWLEKYFSAQATLKGSLIIGHGDLQQSNIIWDNNDAPWLIDWEGAGLIHPQIELLGVLLNWSGINVGDLNEQSFYSILQGYRESGGEVKIDENVLWASIGSWFNWLLYNLQPSNVVLNNNEPELIQTLQTLQRLVNNFAKIRAWINP